MKHLNKVTQLSVPADKVSPGWQMLLTSVWNETWKVSESGDRGEFIGGRKHGKSRLRFFTFSDVYLDI